MPTTYPYWDATNRYIVAGPKPVVGSLSGGPTVFAQLFQLPNGWWQLRCYGSRSLCPEKLGPFFGPLSAAQAAIQSHCQNAHFISQGGPPVSPLAPKILSISPTFGKINTAFTLAINGQNFAATSLIYFDGTSVPGTVFTSAQHLSCPIAATQIPTARYYSVQVIDSVSGSSNMLYFAADPTSALFNASLPRATAPADPTTPSKIIVTHS